MQIRRVNPADDPRDLAALLPAFQQYRNDYLPDFPDFGEVRLRLRCSNGYRQQAIVFAAFADESAAEGLVICDFDQDENLDLAEIDVLVPAGPRACDVEKALFDEARRQTAELGRKRLWFGVPDSADPAGFVARQGGAKHNETGFTSMLDLSTIDRAQYAAWAGPSAKNSGYSLVGWHERCPDELVESYCAALDAMADQPIGTSEYEWAKNDVERLRFREAHAARFGLRKYVQAAIAPDGTVAGFHVLTAYPDEPIDIEVWDTGIARQHRGHGLGLRLKAANALWVLEDRPDTRRVRTFNNDENKWMLAVNRALGYRATGSFLYYEVAVGRGVD